MTDAIATGIATTQTSATAADQQRAAERAAAARRTLSAAALDRFPAARDGNRRALRAAKKWRDEMYAILGLDQAPVPAVEAETTIVPPAPPRLVATDSADDNWRADGACIDTDPEAFFPLSPTSVREINTAKSICRRCDVRAECLNWAIETGAEYGIWGGLTEQERRAEQLRQGAAA